MPLIAPGDPLPHEHDLPTVPIVPVARFNGRDSVHETVKLENAVAECSTCHQLFVSREDPDGWGRVVRWVPLRWWHRRAWAKLRVERARRVGGVAP